MIFQNTFSYIFIKSSLWIYRLNCSFEYFLLYLLFPFFNMLMSKYLEIAEHRSVIRKSVIFHLISKWNDVFVSLKPKYSVSPRWHSHFFWRVILITSFIKLKCRFELYFLFLVFLTEVNLLSGQIELVEGLHFIQRVSAPTVGWELDSFFIWDVCSEVEITKKEFDFMIFILVYPSFFFIQKGIIYDLSPLLQSLICFRLTWLEMTIAKNNRGII